MNQNGKEIQDYFLLVWIEYRDFPRKKDTKIERKKIFHIVKGRCVSERMSLCAFVYVCVCESGSKINLIRFEL